MVDSSVTRIHHLMIMVSSVSVGLGKGERRCWWRGRMAAPTRTSPRSAALKPEQIAAVLAARNWPPDAAGLPWVESAYPQ
jgi:hypothetical protein